MKLYRFFSACLIQLALGLFLLTALGSPAFAGDLKLEAQLIWGTNDEKSPDPKHKQVDPKVEKKLKNLPFKWKHHFEVNKEKFSLKDGETKKISLSRDCEIKVRNAGNHTVELQIFGKGECVGKISQALPKDELLVTGGNAANFTAWFVVLRQPD